MAIQGDAGALVDDRPREHMDQDLDGVLTDGEFALFQRVARARRVDGGMRLFRRGDLGTTMYVIAQGGVDLDFGDDLVGKRLGPRGFFGELGLLVGDHARSADAIAVGDTVLLELEQYEFDRLAERDPHVLSHFLRRAILRVVRNEQGLVRRLRRRNLELQTALDTLRATRLRFDRSEGASRKDELTGLQNRRGFDLQVQQRRRNDVLAGRGLLLVDCDGIEAINAAHGRLAGDRVLQGVASLVRAVAGAHDIACRLGGGQFCLLVQADGRDALLRKAGFIVSAAQALNTLQSPMPLASTVSIGACLVHPDATWNDWYAQADTALHRARRLGGNRVEWQEPA